MTFEQEIKNIQDMLTSENQRICELQKKLATYDEDIEKRNELKIRNGNLQQRAEDLENKMKQMNEEQSCMISVQKRKLKTCEEEECCLRTKVNKAVDANECMTKKINSLTESKQVLLTEIENLKKILKNLENELCNAETKANELRCKVDGLAKNVKCKDEELGCARGQVSERQAEVGRLCEEYDRLKTEVECDRSKLADAKSRAARAEECLAQEKHALCCELESKRAALRCVKDELADAKLTAERERANVGRLVVLAAEQREANERDQRDAAGRAQRMNKDNRDREQSVCRMKHQMSELQRDGERIEAEAEAVKAQVRASECLLEKIKSSEDVKSGHRAGRNDHRREQLERDRDTLACDVRKKSKKIANLEQQVCCLRGEIGALQPCKTKCCTPTAICCSVCTTPKKCPPAETTTCVSTVPDGRVKICSLTKCCSTTCTCSLLQ